MPAATHYVAGLAAGALPVAPHDPVTGMPSAAALAELGSRLKAAGDWRGAAERYYEALRLDPTLLVAELNLGALFLASGDLQHALEHTERAYTLDPRSVDAMNNMGAICQAQANFETAAQWYRAALRLSPSCEATLSGLAMALVSRGLQIKSQDPKGAIKCYQEALVHSPMNANAYYNLGVSYAERHKYDKALINYSLTVHFDPRCAEAYNNMGVIYKEQENLDKALKCYHMAIQCNPRFAQTLNNLGVAYTTTGRLQEALEYLSRAVAVAPTYAEAYNNLGWLFWDHGDLAQALRMYERCIELSPTSKNPSQNRLLALNYLHGVSSERVFAAHRAWGERFCRELGHPFTDWLSARQMKRPLRVGYISPDFFTHSVSFFCHCLFEHRNSELFDIYLYSNTAREDEKTELFKNMVPPDRWKKVLGRPAQEVANLIREDSIDILIELAGHTANNRLDVVALKPAPVQFTYIGYNNTTGLGAVDYRVTDAVVDPPDSQQPFSEELVRLPGCFLCYTPPARIPDVEPLPALRTGYITFGSFSCLAKVSAPCVALWARVLREVPGSRLLVKNKGFYSADVQATFIEHFKRHGIAEDRLKLMALAPTSFDHLKIYNEVDIALDTFPYSNTTTSCETLLMGVPVVCLAGSTHGSRVGMTLLNAIGLSEFAAANQEEYVAKAKGLAGDLQTLATVRQNLRQIMCSSMLCDGRGFVRDKFEPMLLEKWRLFCEGRPPSAQAFTSVEPPDPLAPGPFAPALPPGAPIVGAPSAAAIPAPVVPVPQLVAAAAPPATAASLGAALPPTMVVAAEAAQPATPTVLSRCPTSAVPASKIQPAMLVPTAVCGGPVGNTMLALTPGRRRPRARGPGRHV
uniref:Probable UDP-N-acetylglucosamine--peptide N-acetylglucosaminyltransferase SPINDLY n=1 Tax=Alexandrium monilatum TaxID=311494 RepID=A0A7S4UB31_9DINO|mmetsp:Transcript_88563/g.274237  ORF Transcript_88563/g.274237 Transcript_88563/m.274237 type:complete len:863 (+) Transcript_88563:31-2619(+)